MAVAVIRDTVANSSLQNILSDRKALKDAVVKACQDAVKGWGIQVETIEISQVLIKSQKFFNYLQTQFRDEENLKAERIRSEINNIMRKERLERE